MGKLDQSTSKLGSSLSNLQKQALAAGAAYLSVSGVLNVGRQAIANFKAQEQAERALSQQLGGSINGLKRYAAELQRITTFGDEVTLAAMARLAAFTKEDAAIRSLSVAAQDFAAAKGRALVESADLIGRTFATSTNLLMEHGIEVTGAAGSYERLKSIVDAVAASYGGMAKALADTDTGKLDQIANAWGDILEPFGAALASLIVGAANELNALGDTVSKIIQPFDTLRRLIAGDYDFFPGATEAGREAEEAAQSAARSLKSMREEAAKAAVAAAAQTAQADQDAAIVAIAYEMKLDAMRRENDMALRDRLIDEADARRELAMSYAPNVVDFVPPPLPPDAIDAQLEYNGALLARLEAMEEEKRLTEEFIELYPKQAAALGMVVNAEEAARRATAARIAVGAQLAGGIASLNSALKGSAMVTKRLMQAQAIIDTYAGANREIGRGGLLGFLGAAAVIAYGLANVAQINRQNFADGGWVRGHGGARSDTVDASLSPGERVLSAQEIAQIGGRGAVDAMASGAGAGGGITLVFNGPVTNREFVRDVIMPEIESAQRRRLA
jgi:hypothetical protein